MLTQDFTNNKLIQVDCVSVVASSSRGIIYDPKNQGS